MTSRKKAAAPVKKIETTKDSHLKGNIGLQGPRKVNAEKSEPPRSTRHHQLEGSSHRQKSVIK